MRLFEAAGLLQNSVTWLQQLRTKGQKKNNMLYIIWPHSKHCEIPGHLPDNSQHSVPSLSDPLYIMHAN